MALAFAYIPVRRRGRSIFSTHFRGWQVYAETPVDSWVYRVEYTPSFTHRPIHCHPLHSTHSPSLPTSIRHHVRLAFALASTFLYVSGRSAIKFSILLLILLILLKFEFFNSLDIQSHSGSSHSRCVSADQRNKDQLTTCTHQSESFKIIC